MNLFVGVWNAKLAARELFRPRRYAAPEVLMGKGGSEKSDIFSFGVSVLEVYQGRAPSRASGFKVQACFSRGSIVVKTALPFAAEQLARRRLG